MAIGNAIKRSGAGGQFMTAKPHAFVSVPRRGFAPPPKRKSSAESGAEKKAKETTQSKPDNKEPIQGEAKSSAADSSKDEYSQNDDGDRRK